MIIDYTREIFSGEIWKKSRCLEHEHQANLRLFDLLHSQGFEKTDHFRIWKKNHKTVIVCLVDDIRSCSTDYHIDLPYVFDRHTTVITDNWLTCPSIFSVIQVPKSFFGIYSYTPDLITWQPDRDFAFQINRIDPRRFKLMVDLSWRSCAHSGYINFNCEDRANPGLTKTQAFEQFVSAMGPGEEKYTSTYERIRTQVPIKNYDIAFDLVPYRSWLNIVVETYSSDTVVSVSEKIFRSLITPAPWTVYSGRYTVAYLESLGFDCMSDMVDHNHYDRLKEVENKIPVFNWKSLEIVNHLKSLGEAAVRERCVRASQQNQKILQKMAQAWPEEFSNWVDTLPSQLADKSSL
jgi:hypothetical protein